MASVLRCAFLLFTTLAIHCDCSSKCLSCTNLKEGEQCQHIVTCPDNEVCFHEKYTTSQGETRYDVGCVEQKLCLDNFNNVFGRRSTEGRHLLCGKCCAGSNYCNGNMICDSQPRFPKECEDLHSDRSGVYKIYPTNEHQPVQVFCIMENGKKWTVIQRRYNGSVDFNRTWNEYKVGFGSAYGEYWLGNSHIHQMSINGSHELSVLLVKKNGIKAYANYSKFSVGDEQSQFLLHVTVYHGDAGDSMSSSGGNLGGNMKRFTTKDRDNDDYINNCAQTFKGGWWYGQCRWSGINEIYRFGTLYWESSVSIVSSIMMIRRT